MRDRHNQTPLHGAADFGSEAHLAILLDRGAQINAPDGDGWTPLHCAAAAGRVPETTFLVSRGADVSRRDHKGQTPLNHALANHHLDAPGDDRRRQLELLLGGFLAVKVVAAKPDWLGISVEEVHVSYLEAERQAKHEGTLTIPAKLFPKLPEAGDCLIYRKGLSPVLDEAWRREWQRRGWWEESRRRDLGIEPER